MWKKKRVEESRREETQKGKQLWIIEIIYIEGSSRMDIQEKSVDLMDLGERISGSRNT